VLHDVGQILLDDSPRGHCTHFSLDLILASCVRWGSFYIPTSPSIPRPLLLLPALSFLP
jgi:hypothetical protein